MLIDWPTPRIRSRKAKMVVLTVRDASLLSKQRINEKVIKPIHLQLVPELSIGFFVKAVDFYTKNRMYFGIGKRKSELTGQRHHLILFLKYERSRNRANR